MSLFKSLPKNQELSLLVLHLFSEIALPLDVLTSSSPYGLELESDDLI